MSDTRRKHAGRLRKGTMTYRSAAASENAGADVRVRNSTAMVNNTPPCVDGASRSLSSVHFLSPGLFVADCTVEVLDTRRHRQTEARRRYRSDAQLYKQGRPFVRVFLWRALPVRGWKVSSHMCMHMHTVHAHAHAHVYVCTCTCTLN